MIDIVVGAGAERDLGSVIEPNAHQRLAGHALRANDGAEHAVLDVLAAEARRQGLLEDRVLEENHPIADGEFARTPLSQYGAGVLQLALFRPCRPNTLIERDDIRVGMGEHEQFIASYGLALRGGLGADFASRRHPIGHDLTRGIDAIHGLANGAVRAIGFERRTHLATGQLAGRLLRPHVLLPPDAAQFEITDPFGNGAERRAGLDRLQLHGISDQHELGAGGFDRRDHARHLLRRHHAGFVDDEHIALGELVAAGGPGVLPGCQCARRDP